ncbi:MAG TPA: glycoside hydrolase family 43 protein [Pseudonocardia sp.]|jgi:beta-xylosidase|uniref:glycoside hydrolase family 43 protein n=1 Tax=Pseudonocardia sp. TaxID=60912 RepID=UPI002EDA65DD
MSPLPRGGWARLLKTGPAFAAIVAAATASTIQPVIARDFPDPAILAVGSVYYAYSTASNYGGGVWHVPVQRASSLTGKWTEVGDAMPDLPAWVGKNAQGSGNVWAPEVAARSDGSYILYFTARSAAKSVQCIGVALASSPKGPFRPVGTEPLVCRPEDVDSIDPSAFTDTDGKQYLLYTSGRGKATIWLQQVSVDGITPIGARRPLIQADRPEEGNIVEAPAMVKHGNKYVLFYSGNAFNSGKYFVNYASGTSLSGTFTKRDGQFLNRDTLGGAYPNPGGEEVVPGRKHDYMLFHAYTNPGRRSMFVVGLGWDSSGNPNLELDNVVKAPPTKP